MTRQDVESACNNYTDDKEEDHSTVDWEIVKEFLDDIEKRVKEANTLVSVPRNIKELMIGIRILDKLSDDLY